MAVPSQNRYVELEGKEFVVNKRATERYLPLLERINREGVYATGGIIAPNFQAMNQAIASRQGIGDNATLERLISAVMESARTPVIADVREVTTAQEKSDSRRARATLGW